MDPQLIQQILQMMGQQKQDPFERPLPAQGLLGDGGMTSIQPAPMQTNSQQMVPSMQGDPNMGGQPQEQFGLPQETISTSFANTQPGLPNLPDSFGGFGYGQFAPKEFNPPGIRQQYIQKMMSMIPHMQGMGQGMSQGMGSNSSNTMPGLFPKAGGYGGGF